MSNWTPSRTMANARSDDLPFAFPAAARRCPACGRRIAGHCRIHGAPPADGDETSSHALRVELPRIEGYRVRGLVACGGFGTVFDGTSQIDGARVAIKVARSIRKDARVCLDRELAALLRIGPPHVPVVLARGETAAGEAYVVMDYVAEPTLADRTIRRSAPWTPREAGAVVLAILDALERTHACGYAHRDLKPENIFISNAPAAILVDFGLAAPLDAECAIQETTQEREAAGTAEYMAPERCEGLPIADVRTDLYAVGIILFELLAERPPFWGPRAVVRESQMSRRPPRLSALAGDRAVPTAIEEIVARCLAKDPADRFGTAAELRAVLASALRGAGAGAAERGRALCNDAPATPAHGMAHATVGLVFFQTETDRITLNSCLAALGAHLGGAMPGRCAAVVPDGPHGDPAQRALRVAKELIRRGVCARARVDVARVAVRARSDGSRAFISPLFSHADRYPSDHDVEGVTLTPAAAAVVDDRADTAAAAARIEQTRESPTPDEAPPFVGREAILTALLESASRAAEGAVPTAVSVVGDAGQGKSRLARVLARQLRAPGRRVLSVRAAAPALGDADRTLAQLLSLALHLPDAPPTDGGAELLRERLEAHTLDDLSSADPTPAVALALGWIAPGAASSPLYAGLRSLDAAPGALRAALTMVAGAALRQLAARGPLVVIVDDAHFAGDIVLSALEYAVLAEARAPIWICALGRPEFLHERPAWGQGAARWERHELGALDAGGAAELCRRLLLPVESVPDAAVQRLVERTGGSPLLLVELVRGLHRDGIVRKSPRGEGWYLATDELDRVLDSPLVEWLARREIEALSPSLAAHARLIAVLGDRVTHGEVEALLRRLERQGDEPQFPLDAKVGTRRLLAARVLDEDGPGCVSYRHALMRDAVSRSIPESQRRRIHAAAVEYYEAGSADLDEERRLSQLAYHAGEAGIPGPAARAYITLAARARARHAYADAERLYTRALAQPGGVVDRRAAHRGRGLMRYRIGRYHDALSDFACAREMAARDGDAAEQIAIILDEATALDWMDAYQTSADRVDEARALLPVVSSPLLEARVLLGLGRSAFRFSRNAEAADLLERAAAAVEALSEEGDDGGRSSRAEGYETRVIALIQLGFLLPGLGRHDDAHRALDRVVALCEEHGDQLHLSSALNVRGMLWANLGDRDRLMADMKRSLSIARALGQVSLELMGEFNLAEFLLFLGDHAAAEPHVRRAQALDRRLSGDAGRADVPLLEARLLMYRGEERAAAEIAARLRAPSHVPLLPSQDVLCTMIELSLRDASPAEWDALEERAERYAVLQERLEVIEARGVYAVKQGHVDEARCHFERALGMVARSPNVMNARLVRRLTELASSVCADRTLA
ncbi:protein kinase [Sorangium sp. So ce134]